MGDYRKTHLLEQGSGHRNQRDLPRIDEFHPRRISTKIDMRFEVGIRLKSDGNRQRKKPFNLGRVRDE